MYWRLLSSDHGLWNSTAFPSDVTCHLVAVRGTPTWQCGIWILRTDITGECKRNYIQYRVAEWSFVNFGTS